MFKSLLKISSKLVMTILLVLLVLSFAFWGIGDVFRGNTNTAIAKVGDYEITREEHRQAMQREMQRLRNMFGGNLPEETLRSLNIGGAVLSQMVNEKLLKLEAERLGLSIGEEMILHEVGSNPQFRDEQGNFNRAAFAAFLRQVGASEKAFIDELKDGLAIGALVDSISTIRIAPSSQVKLLSAYNEERRVAEIIKIPANFIKSTPEPTDADLIEYYEKQKESFKAPEYRTISYIELGPKTLAGEIKISDETLRLAYDERKEEFFIAEERDIMHMLFDEKAKADEALTALKKGADFYKTAKEKAGQDKEQSELFATTKEGLLADIAAPVFALKKGQVSDVIESSLGFHIVKIKEVKPAHQKSFEEVNTILKKDMEKELMSESIYKLANGLEDELASGSSLSEAGKALGLKVQRLESISIDGKKIDGSEVELPVMDNFLAVAFGMDEGVDSGIVADPAGENSFILVVDRVTQPRFRALDEVRGRVIRAWKEDNKKEKLRMEAEAAAGKIKAGESSMKAEAAKFGTKITTTEPLKRDAGMKGDILNAAAIIELFSLKPGEITGVYEGREGGYIIAGLKNIIPVDEEAAKDSAEEMEEQLQNSFAENIFAQYVTFLRYRYPVEIYDSAAEQTGFN